jgi:hypothetical protein
LFYLAENYWENAKRRLVIQPVTWIESSMVEKVEILLEEI